MKMRIMENIKEAITHCAWWFKYQIWVKAMSVADHSRKSMALFSHFSLAL